jgi:hypothetical protein
MPATTLLRTSILRASATSRLTTARAGAARQMHGGRALGMPYKDDQDRESLKPRAQDYSKSGSDDATAANEDAAFNPSKTRPEQEKETAGVGNEGNPLEASPANKEFAESGRGKAEDKPGHQGAKPASGASSGPKKGKVV